MATIYIDNQPYEFADGHNLLHVSLSLGFNLPYFCWHPAMGSVGACRLCAVKQFRDENDTRGRLVMACMTPATNNTRISIKDDDAQSFRRSVIEWLMVNHPHDCPVCDEGGECHLQDMTYMTGHDYREYRFKKRTYRNQYLGPFVNHEMNRCIQCYRCVRYYRDYAGGDDLQVFSAHDHVYFGRHEDGVLQSEFSGNLVEICPTGVFTDKTQQEHYTRKWDLQTAPSICVHCSVGCNTIPGERYGTLRRLRSRYNGEVNRYFLCDRGRYGYEFVNGEDRIRQPLLRTAASDAPTSLRKADALRHLASILADSVGVVGIGSPRASLEANFALRALVGPERFCAGVAEEEQRLVRQMIDVLQKGPAHSPSLHDIEQTDAIFILGEDVSNTAPMLALALRQGARQEPMQIADALKIPEWQDHSVRDAMQGAFGPCFIATPAETRLDGLATQTYRAAPDDIARLGFAVAQALNPAAPAVNDLSDELRTLADQIAQALQAAKRPLIVAGASLGSASIVQAAANVAWALCNGERTAELAYVFPAANSLGLGLMSEHSLALANATIQDGTSDTVIILENDLYRHAAAATVDAMLGKAKHVIVLDAVPTRTTAKAELVLPAATFAEGDGTLVNNEGRAQRFYQVFLPAGDVQESWRWLADLMAVTNRPDGALHDGERWLGLDDVTAALVQAFPVFKPVPEIAPPASFRIAGEKIARQPHRYSGRTAMYANITLVEPKPPEDVDAPFNFSMEGYQGEPPPALIREFWAPGWNSVQSVNKFQSEVNGPLHGGDPGRRLIEPNRAAQIVYFDQTPAAFAPRPGEWLVTPLYHVFGSEELSARSPGIAELTPQPYLGLNPADAARLQVQEGETVTLALGGATQPFAMRLLAALPPGIAGVLVGLPNMPQLALPQWGKVEVGRQGNP